MDDLPILDGDRLRLITRGDAALAEEFMDALFSEADELIERLNASVTGNDRSATSGAAHTLKGMATELGAQRLRAAAAALEKEQQPERWPQLLERVKRSLDELRRRPCEGA